MGRHQGEGRAERPPGPAVLQIPIHPAEPEPSRRWRSGEPGGQVGVIRRKNASLVCLFLPLSRSLLLPNCLSSWFPADQKPFCRGCPRASLAFRQRSAAPSDWNQSPSLPCSQLRGSERAEAQLPQEGWRWQAASPDLDHPEPM